MQHGVSSHYWVKIAQTMTRAITFSQLKSTETRVWRPLIDFSQKTFSDAAASLDLLSLNTPVCERAFHKMMTLSSCCCLPVGLVLLADLWVIPLEFSKCVQWKKKGFWIVIYPKGIFDMGAISNSTFIPLTVKVGDGKWKSLDVKIFIYKTLNLPVRMAHKLK